MKGSYILIIKLEENKKIQIGRLEEIFFKNGFYVYVGSALNRIDKRINRHLKKSKKKQWHIDYLLDYAKVIEIFYKESESRLECNIAEIFDKQLFSIHGFGCSDCKCKSHLFFGSYEKIKNVIKNLEMTQYALKKKGEN